MEFLRVAALWICLWSGQSSVSGVKWHTLRSCLSHFIFQQEWGAKAILLKVNPCAVWLRFCLPTSVKWERVQTSQFSPHLNQTCFCSTPWFKGLLKTVKTKLILIYLGEDLKDTPGSQAESVRESNENQRASQLLVMAGLTPELVIALLGCGKKSE